jgi:hypothetical protein
MRITTKLTSLVMLIVAFGIQVGYLLRVNRRDWTKRN